MNVNRYISAAAAIVAVAASAVAQEPLSKEITVDKEIVPQEREAQRLQLTPKIVRPEVQYKKLAWSSLAVPADPVNGVRVLPPAPWEASVEPDPYRGYVAGGYMPLTQFGLAAGYRLLNTEQTVANVALQYSGLNYKGTPRLFNGEEFKTDYKYQTVTAGANIEHAIYKDMLIGADLDYTYSAYSTPLLEVTPEMVLGNIEFPSHGWYDKDNSVDLNRIKGGLHFEHRPGAFSYGLHGGVDYTAFSGMSGTETSSMLLNAGISLNYAINKSSKFTATFDCRNVRFKGNYWNNIYGVLDAKFAYNLTKDNYSLTIGAHLSSRCVDEKGTLIYPELKLAVTPTQQFSAYVNIEGGHVELNSFGRMLSEMPYLSGRRRFSPTHDKWRGDAGINFGPFSGLTLEVWGGYSDVRNLWMPRSLVYCKSEDLLDGNIYPFPPVIIINNSNYTGEMGCNDKFTSIHYGVAVGYKYGRKVAFRLSYEAAPDGDNKGYSQWLDRAKSEIKAHLSVSPTEKLEINADFSFRDGRKHEVIYTTLLSHVCDFMSLGTAASLDLGASYKLNKRVTLWADVDNILNRRWQMFYGVMNPGVTGLVGATYKF